MTHKEILNYCLTKKGAYQDSPFGDGSICVKVKKRIFAQLFYLKGEPMFTFNGDMMTGDYYRRAFPDDIKRGYHCPPVQSFKKNWKRNRQKGAENEYYKKHKI